MQPYTSCSGQRRLAPRCSVVRTHPPQQSSLSTTAVAAAETRCYYICGSCCSILMPSWSIVCVYYLGTQTSQSDHSISLGDHKFKGLLKQCWGSIPHLFIGPDNWGTTVWWTNGPFFAIAFVLWSPSDFLLFHTSRNNGTTQLTCNTRPIPKLVFMLLFMRVSNVQWIDRCLFIGCSPR